MKGASHSLINPIIIEQKIYEVRGQKVMFDFDLASIYGVETRVLNQAIKRNIENFPRDFMFKLSLKEWKMMSSQIVMTSSGKRPKTALPYVFTEHGVTMLASVLKSSKARRMNIAIVRAFIALKKYALNYRELSEQISEIRKTVKSHSGQLNQIYEVIEKMLDDKAEQRTWKERERIGFRRKGRIELNNRK